LFQQFK